VRRRLSEARLDRLPRWVERPHYDRTRLQAGVVHLGIGAFHRAHQAPVFDALAEAGDLRWGIRAASLRSPAVRDSLAPQDGLYSLVVENRVKIIGALREVLVAPEDPQALVAALAAPETHLVTVTVTEKGYLPDPADRLNTPRSAAAFIAAGLRLRRERELPPLTAISCDNLPHNGRALAAAVLRVGRAEDSSLADWIERHAPFPETMVDRIVPATRAEDIDALAVRIGLEDRAMVKTEPFSQWVIEDRFAGERPDFAAAGVQLTRSVAPWEEAKLRLLNGAHSAMAYLGGLAGVETVDRFVAAPAGRRLVETLWDEAEATLAPPPELDLAAYRASLMRRFANGALGHRLRQIAMDGSQKLPQRLLAPIQARLDRGLAVEALSLAVAAWMRWQGGRTDAGERFAVDDPLAAETARRLAGTSCARERVRALLALRAVFPERLAADPRFEAALVRHLDVLERLGAAALIEQFACCAAEEA
jgi:fructuronate reductase